MFAIVWQKALIVVALIEMKKSVLFGSNSQVLALFDMNYVLLSFDFNSEKSVYAYLCLLVIFWVLVLFDMNSEKVSIGRQ